MSNQGLFVFFFSLVFYFFLSPMIINDLFHQMNRGFRNYPHLLCRYRETKKHRIVHLVILYFSLYEINFIMNYSLFRSYYSNIGLFFLFLWVFVCVVWCVFFHYLPSQYFAVLRFLFM